MSELSAQFDGAAYSGLVSVTSTATVVIPAVDVQAYRLFSLYVQNVGGGGGHDFTIATEAAPTEDGPWMSLGHPSVAITSGQATRLSTEVAVPLKYLRFKAACAGVGQNTTAKVWLCVLGYDSVGEAVVPAGELISQFNGDAVSAVTVLTSSNEVVIGPLDVQDYDRFVLYVQNLRTGAGDDLEDLLFETAPTALGPWISIAPNGVEADMTEDAFLASWHTQALKYIRVRASVDAAESTSAQFWLSAGVN